MEIIGSGFNFLKIDNDHLELLAPSTYSTFKKIKFKIFLERTKRSFSDWYVLNG